MWIVWTLVSFAVLGYLGYAWMSALTTKYSHTKESLLVLAALACLAGGAGVVLANQVAPSWTAGPKAAITIGVAFTAFTLFSFIAVNLWCSLLTRKFDEKIGALEEEEDAILRKLDLLRWQAIRQSERVPIQAVAPKPPEDEYSALVRTLESWEQGGGAARIRSVKVSEWKEVLSGKSLAALMDELGALEKDHLSEADETKREQTKAHWSLVKMEILDRKGRTSIVSSYKEEAPALPIDEVTSRERLQAIQGEISTERKLKAEFIQNRVRLTWRATE